MSDAQWFKSDSEFRPKKCCKALDGGVDRISQLPDEIIVFILSFLSMREAAATSILSPRWLDLWKHTPNLEFSAKSLNTSVFPTVPAHWIRKSSLDVSSSPYMRSINTIIHSHKALFLKQFSINAFVNESSHSTVTKWLEFVFSRQVENLDLSFQCPMQLHPVSLTQLLRDDNIRRGTPQHQIFFKSLKMLCLSFFIASGEDIELFVGNCPLLEQLYVRSVHLTSDVEVSGTSLVLKHFDISHNTGNASIKVSAPKLTWLTVDDRLGPLSLENNPKLVGMSFTYSSPSTNLVQHFASAVSCCISQLNVLKLNLNRPAVHLVNGFPEMPNLKKLFVKYIGPTGHSLLPVTALINASPRLQEFKLEFFPAPKRRFDVKVTMDVVRCMHQHLRTFQFEGFGGSAGAVADHIELVRYILDECIELRQIVITPTTHKDKEQIARDYAKEQLQGKLPRRVLLHIA